MRGAASCIILLALTFPALAQQEPTTRELLAIINERQVAEDQRFKAQEQAIQAALASAEKAVNKAEQAAEKRFDAVNEFRGQLKDQAATFVTRTELYAGLIAALTLAIGAMQLMLSFASYRERAGGKNANRP